MSEPPPASIDPRAVDAATIDASAPREQHLLDGWLLRFSPGKAKRARSIQAVAAGAMPLDAKLAACVARYRAAGLPALVRITPFSEPCALDAALEARGWRRFDDTRVLVRAAAGPADGRPRVNAGHRLVDVPADAHARWVGAERGSPAAEIDAHVARVAASPVPYRALHLRDADDRTVAGGQIAVDASGHAGLYDVHTVADRRGAGHAGALCAALVADAAAAGARVAYLQVDAANVAALRVYRRLGFSDAYPYHYREAP